MALIEGLNYVESTIQNELLDIAAPTNTQNATLVIGTARRGKTGVITKTTIAGVSNIFGDAPDSIDFDTNLTHAVQGILASTAGRDKEIYSYKVGDSSSASLVLRESQVFPNGDTSFSFDDEGDPVASMTFESKDEDTDANNASVVVRGDDSGLSSSMIITLPDGYTKVFTVDPYGTRPGIAKNVQELNTLILGDTNITAFMRTSFNILRKTNLEVIVSEGTGVATYIDVESPAVSGSWGDKLVNIESINELITYTEEIKVGNLINRLTYAPTKDDDPATVTIDSFYKVVEDEIILNAGLTDVGTTLASSSLAMANPTLAWDQSDASVVDMEVVFVRSGVETVIDPTEWTFTAGVLDVTISAAEVGDIVKVSYKFGASLVEANVRSSLVIGDENSYFVAGNDLIFGAAPSLQLGVTYDAVKTYLDSDLNIIDRNNIKIEFINPNNAPIAGTSVYITFTYLPELPAPSGATLVKSDSSSFGIQRSSLSGGTSGSFISKQRYKELVLEALDETMLMPFRRVIVAGAFLDDSVDGIDQETGLFGTVNLNWATDLGNKLDYKSKVSGECHTVIGVKPISPTLLEKGSKGINEWYSYLLDDLDDPNSAATAIGALDDYHVDVALASALVSVGEILAGTQYIENPAYIVTGMQLDGTLIESLIRQNVPPNVKSLLTTFPSGGIVGRLNTAGYTALALNPKGEIRITDAPTGNDPRKTMARQIVRDSVYTAVLVARDIANTFIGLRRDATRLSIMQSKINREVVRALVPDILTHFNAEIIPVAGGYITGETKMRLFMETSVEIRRIIFETTVKLGGEAL